MPGQHHHHHHYHRHAGNNSSASYSSYTASSTGGSMSRGSYEQTYGLEAYSSRGGGLKWRCVSPSRFHFTIPQLLTWKQCRCDDGWFSTAIDDYCPNCHSARCSNCQFAR
ncbi:hypothetical protein HJFPF1_05264 [Paramyrothecium foliicola]|nr:hypothetical protein HJFPF1_05264 [Paramyrothecium foliicola]